MNKCAQSPCRAQRPDDARYCTHYLFRAQFYVLPKKLVPELSSGALVIAISIRNTYDTVISLLEHVTKRKIDINAVARYPFGHVCQIKTILQLRLTLGPSHVPSMGLLLFGS